MQGKKIDQAKAALRHVIENLKDDDTFNIIAYDDRVEAFKPELQRWSTDSRRDALRFVDNINAGGSTNINDAIQAALAMLKSADRPNYILFLTDGLPTAGEVREIAIAENAKKANQANARLVVFGVGFDVNARLLDRLSGGNGGASEYVTPDQDIEASVARVASRLTSPVLSAISITMDGVDINRTYPRDIPDLFDGGQLVWVGRFRQSARSTVEIRGKVGTESRSISIPVELAREGDGRSYEFVERLWAIRRVGFLIDQIDLNGKNKELLDELVAISTKYGILTPYTSFLADERVNLHALTDNQRRAGENLDRLSDLGGFGGVSQRAAKQTFLNAERFASSAPTTPAGPGARGAMAKALAPTTVGRVAQGYSLSVQDADGAEKLVTTVRQLGKKTFYRKGDHWVDASIKPDQESKAKTVVQFSDDYFKLARAQSAELNQYLTFEEPVTVELGGEVYKIERPAPQP
jgi:Ca-activated chloride channel family protein